MAVQCPRLPIIARGIGKNPFINVSRIIDREEVNQGRVLRTILISKECASKQRRTEGLRGSGILQQQVVFRSLHVQLVCLRQSKSADDELHTENDDWCDRTIWTLSHELIRICNDGS